MKIVFSSNYLNHHQAPFCNELQKIDGVEFTFIATKAIREERLALGYENMNMYPYVLRAYEDEEQTLKAKKLCHECDILICGDADDKVLFERAQSGKPLFVFSERMFKGGIIHMLSPRVIKRMKKFRLNFRQNCVYLFCNGAFTAADYKRFGVYKNKAYKWGYFPEVKKYNNINELISKKRPNSILWVGRLLDWKHPELAVSVAKQLKEKGYNFTLDIIGTGEMEEQIRQMVNKNGLNDCVCCHGSMSPEKAREYMEKSEVFLFTSDRNEGWGAVLNESMNSGCATISSHIIGSVPFMVQNSENGLIYKDGNANDLYKKVKYLLDNPAKTKELGVAAYNTCVEQWNPENAAKRFYSFACAVLNEQDPQKLFEKGVCSKAENLKDNWL